MSENARDELIARVLANEGGVAQVPGEDFITRWGQTPQWLTTFNLPIPTSLIEAADNYAEWLRITKLDAVIGTQADDLAEIVIDFAVHSGHGPAIRMLQVAVGVKADGVIGPATIAAIKQVDRQKAARNVLAGRMEQIGGLIADNPSKFSRYARGWLRRVGSQVRKLT